MTATDVRVSDEPVSEPPPVPLDERITYRGPMSKWLMSPEVGALIGAVIVWTFFWGNGQTFGEADTTLNWLDVAAPTGIMAAAVALLMIGGEFDLSSGVITGATAIQIGLMSRFFLGTGINIGWGNRFRLPGRRSDRLVQRLHGQQDGVAELHRHPRIVLHASRRDVGSFETTRRQGAGRQDH